MGKTEIRLTFSKKIARPPEDPRAKYKFIAIEMVLDGKTPALDTTDYVRYLKEEKPKDYDAFKRGLRYRILDNIRHITKSVDDYFVRGAIIRIDPSIVYGMIAMRWETVHRLRELAKSCNIRVKVDASDAEIRCRTIAGIVLREGGGATLTMPTVYKRIIADTGLDFSRFERILKHISENHMNGDGDSFDVPAYRLYAGHASLMKGKLGPRIDIPKEELPEPLHDVFRYELHGFEAYRTLSKGILEGGIDGRLYITIKPEKYGDCLNATIVALQEAMLKTEGAFFFKVLPQVLEDGSATRRDQVVVYFNHGSERGVLEEVRSAMRKIVGTHGNVFSDRGPYFTAKIDKGLFFGEDPFSMDRKKQVSFGDLRANILAYAKDEVKRLKEMGYDVSPLLELAIAAHAMFMMDVDPENPAFNLGGTEKFPYIHENIADDQGNHIGG
jgi:hypothetical protein